MSTTTTTTKTTAVTVTPTTPFPRLHKLKDLTWDACFAFTRQQIQENFIAALATNAVAADITTGKLAYLLLDMTHANDIDKSKTSQPESVAITTKLTGATLAPNEKNYPKREELQPEVGNFNDKLESQLRRVFWSPKGSSLKVWCHTLFDLLAACMSDAAWQDTSATTKMIVQKRDKNNYYAKLVSLFSYWCFRLAAAIPGGRPALTGPTMTGITCFRDLVLLGCSIPTVPGTVADVPGKEMIQRSRFISLEGRGRQEGSKKQILDLTKVKTIAQNYGNCAETWAFCLMCMQDDISLKEIYGVAVWLPKVDVKIYDEKVERTRQRYEQLCDNCRKLIMQIGIWDGPAKEAVSANFNIENWTIGR